MINMIQSLLPPGFPWRESIHYYPTIDSTNTQAKHLAAQGAPHGTVLIAGHQTGGRGRLGRSFHSPEGLGIYLSVILRPNCLAKDLMHLTCATAVAMCDAVEAAAAFRPGIKWTNDLIWGKRKLGGILTELSLNPDGAVDYAVVGIHGLCYDNAGIVKNTDWLLKAMEDPKVRFVSHPDDGKNPLDYPALVAGAKELNVALELNNSSLRKPSLRPNCVENYRTMIPLCMEMGVPIIVNTDSHDPGTVGDFTLARELLSTMDINEALILNTDAEKLKAFLLGV